MEHSAGAVIKHNGKYLLIKSRNGFWNFPKGHVEKGETVEQAAIRETKEEVGLDVTLRQRKASIIYTRNNGSQKQVTYFCAKAKNRDITRNEEVLAYRWLRRRGVLKLLAFPEIEQAFKKLTK